MVYTTILSMFAIPLVSYFVSLITFGADAGANAQLALRAPEHHWAHYSYGWVVPLVVILAAMQVWTQFRYSLRAWAMKQADERFLEADEPDSVAQGRPEAASLLIANETRTRFPRGLKDTPENRGAVHREALAILREMRREGAPWHDMRRAHAHAHLLKAVELVFMPTSTELEVTNARRSIYWRWQRWLASDTTLPDFVDRRSVLMLVVLLLALNSHKLFKLVAYTLASMSAPY